MFSLTLQALVLKLEKVGPAFPSMPKCVQVMARLVEIFGINTTRDISKLSYVISRAVRRLKFETILKYHEWYLCQISRTNYAIICLYYYPQKFCNLHMQIFQIKLKQHCFEPIKLQKFKFKAFNNNAGALFFLFYLLKKIGNSVTQPLSALFN